MAIVSWPDDIKMGQVVPCALCGRGILLADASAGRHYITGRQAFACSGHAWDLSRLISGWVNFTIEQQATIVNNRDVTS